MAKVMPNNTDVLVRDTSTTTYHFGVSTPICEAELSERDAAPGIWTLTNAVADGRRLCRLCAKLVEDWTAAALFACLSDGRRSPITIGPRLPNSKREDKADD